VTWGNRHGSLSLPCFARENGLVRFIQVTFCIFALALLTAPAPATAQPWARSKTVEFNGGAIVDFAPASDDTAIVLAAMPDGFSIYSLDFTSGGIIKLVSQTYLQTLVPDSSDIDDLRLSFDFQSGLLLLAARTGNARLVLLNISEAPKLVRYALGIPDDYAAGATAFARGELFICPSLETKSSGSPDILAFNPLSEKLKRIAPESKLALVDELFFVPERESLLMLGTIDARLEPSRASLAWIAQDGRLTPVPGAEGVLLAAVCPDSIAYIATAEAKAAPSDISPESFKLVVISAADEPSARKQISLNSEPAWMGLADSGETALIISQPGVGFGDLWAVNTATRSRAQLRERVMLARMSPSSRACMVLPADKNQLELYMSKP
jgi:hypothetical protein